MVSCVYSLDKLKIHSESIKSLFCEVLIVSSGELEQYLWRSLSCSLSRGPKTLILCVAFHKTWCTRGWVRSWPQRQDCRRGRVEEVVRRNRPHMVLRSWNPWHNSRMLTRSAERLSTGTDLTDSAQLLTCRGAHMDMRTKIACCDPQLDATVRNSNQCQFILSHVNFLWEDHSVAIF